VSWTSGELDGLKEIVDPHDGEHIKTEIVKKLVDLDKGARQAGKIIKGRNRGESASRSGN
jgi:hypothetical protein